MSQDLETAIFRTDGNQWLSLTTEAPQGSPITSANMSRLIFYTSTPLRQVKDDGTAGAAGNPIPGDICAVEYRVTYADPFGVASSTQKTFQLHRVVVDPASTFIGVAGKSLMGIGNNPGPPAPPFAFLTQAFDTLVDKASGPVHSQVAMSQGENLNVSVYGSGTPNSMLADNVAQFNVFLYFYGYNAAAAGAAPAMQAYPQTKFNNISPAAYYYGGGPQGGGTPVLSTGGYLDTYTNAAIPPTFVALAYADVTVTFLTDDGVAILQQYGDTTADGINWAQFLQQYGKTYTQRIRFYNKPH
jgi:hypothetical protein